MRLTSGGAVFTTMGVKKSARSKKHTRAGSSPAGASIAQQEGKEKRAKESRPNLQRHW